MSGWVFFTLLVCILVLFTALNIIAIDTSQKIVVVAGTILLTLVASVFWSGELEERHTGNLDDYCMDQYNGVWNEPVSP